jgi:hypothetical protein
LVDAESSFIFRLRSLHISNRIIPEGDLTPRAYTLEKKVIAESTTEQEAKADSKLKPGKDKRDWFRPLRSKKRNPSDWKPHTGMLHERWLVAFLVALTAVAATVLVVHKYAIGQKLYGTAFVYQVD